MEMWIAPSAISDLLYEVREAHPLLRDHNVQIAVILADSKPFVNDRINLGSLKRFPKLSRLFSKQYDFCLILCAEVWQSILNDAQKRALLDLHLTRIEPEYEPEVVIENKRKKVVKDDWGRVKYTNVVKTNDDGKPKWKLNPLDLLVFTQNVTRHGLWSEDLASFSEAVEKAP